MLQNKARRWEFTFHKAGEYTVDFDNDMKFREGFTEIDVDHLLSIPASACDYLIGGWEICPTHNRHHIQGYVEFKTPLAMSTVKSRLDPVRKSKSPVHVEPARKERDALINYCKKEDTGDPAAIEKYGSKFFIVEHVVKRQGARNDWHKINDFIKENPSLTDVAEEFPEEAIKYSSGIEKLAKAHKNSAMISSFKEQYEDAILRNWQKKLINKLQFPADDRSILWYYDEKGNKGKSWLSRYLVAMHGAARFENASSKDIALAYEGEPIVVFDFSRTTEERLNYQIIESIKNGMVFSPKYNSCSKYFKSPHIICFANWLPKMSAMSADRWRITCLDEDEKEELPSRNTILEDGEDNILDI